MPNIIVRYGWRKTQDKNLKILLGMGTMTVAAARCWPPPAEMSSTSSSCAVNTVTRQLRR